MTSNNQLQIHHHLFFPSLVFSTTPSQSSIAFWFSNSLSTSFLFDSETYPESTNSSRIKYVLWKLKIKSNSHTFPKCLSRISTNCCISSSTISSFSSLSTMVMKQRLAYRLQTILQSLQSMKLHILGLRVRTSMFTYLRKRCFCFWDMTELYHLVRRDRPWRDMRKKQWIIIQILQRMGGEGWRIVDIMGSWGMGQLRMYWSQFRYQSRTPICYSVRLQEWTSRIIISPSRRMISLKERFIGGQAISASNLLWLTCLRSQKQEAMLFVIFDEGMNWRRFAISENVRRGGQYSTYLRRNIGNRRVRSLGCPSFTQLISSTTFLKGNSMISNPISSFSCSEAGSNRDKGLITSILIPLGVQILVLNSCRSAVELLVQWNIPLKLLVVTLFQITPTSNQLDLNNSYFDFRAALQNLILSSLEFSTKNVQYQSIPDIISLRSNRFLVWISSVRKLLVNPRWFWDRLACS